MFKLKADIYRDKDHSQYHILCLGTLNFKQEWRQEDRGTGKDKGEGKGQRYKDERRVRGRQNVRGVFVRVDRLSAAKQCR